MDMPPIVEKMYEVNKWLLHKVGKFPRDQRLLLGQRLMQKSLDVQEDLVAAALKGKGEEKSRLLADISLALEQLRYLLRLARDSRCLSQDSWFFLRKKSGGDRKDAGRLDEEFVINSSPRFRCGRIKVRPPKRGYPTRSVVRPVQWDGKIRKCRGSVWPSGNSGTRRNAPSASGGRDTGGRRRWFSRRQLEQHGRVCARVGPQQRGQRERGSVQLLRLARCSAGAVRGGFLRKRREETGLATCFHALR